ncbi:MAG: polysaccharide deacetylase family protein [Gammaproteobacteria bacterium]|nr:polysaccharide deacetylase family protein [Gammaproteobacteria bacterium]
MTLKPYFVKAISKRMLQHLAASYYKLTNVSDQPQLLILMYHRVLPMADERAQREEPGMIVTPETFRLHIETLKKDFEIIQLSKWLALKKSGSVLPARACAITFDDGWVDNYEFAFPLLRELEVPATIFLVSEMIGTDQQFWPERFALVVTGIARNYTEQWSHPALEWIRETSNHYAFSTLPPNREELSEMIANAKALPDHEIHDRLDNIEETMNLSVENKKASLLNWQQLSEMIKSGLVEAGSHTCNHVRFNESTSRAVLEHEIISSKQQIEKKTGYTVNTFCFPNGDYTPEALALVRQHYAGGVSTLYGWNSASTDRCLLQRIGVHEDVAKNRVAFLARISGWM